MSNNKKVSDIATKLVNSLNCNILGIEEWTEGEDWKTLGVNTTVTLGTEPTWENRWQLARLFDWDVDHAQVQIAFVGLDLVIELDKESVINKDLFICTMLQLAHMEPTACFIEIWSGVEDEESDLVRVSLDEPQRGELCKCPEGPEWNHHLHFCLRCGLIALPNEESEVEPWMVKLVDKALICGEKEFKVVVPTHQHRNDLLAYYKPIYKESEIKVLLKIRVLEQSAPPKAEVPTIEYNNLKSLIEQINGIKRAKVLVSSEDIRRELIAQYQPMYKEVGCFLAVEVK